MEFLIVAGVLVIGTIIMLVVTASIAKEAWTDGEKLISLLFLSLSSLLCGMIYILCSIIFSVI